MTLADLPVLNPSTPGKERGRATIVAALFAVFGALYALARSASSAPPDISNAVSDPVFGFAFPRGWGIVQSAWSGAATWPSRIAAGEIGSTLVILAIVILAIALVVVMHPDILSRQGPQYVSPGRRITTVAVAFALAFLIYYTVGKIDDIFQSRVAMASAPGKALIGYAAVFAIAFGGVWSFVGPKDFGRRIPLRISHGALGGLGVWAAITFATMLSSEPRSFLTSSLDTYYSLLAIDAANGNPGATAGWAISSDVLTAAVAMAVAGALLVATAPQSLGPGNRRGAAFVAGVIGAFLAVVAGTTYSVTRERAAAVNYDIVSAQQLETQAPSRLVLLMAGAGHQESGRAYRMPVTPKATADDCVHGGTDRALPAATAANVTKLAAWLESQGATVNGGTIRAANCLAALRALRWDVEGARAVIFTSPRPERIGALTYTLSVPEIAAATPADMRAILAALSDTARFSHGADAAQRFADLARVAGDTALEAGWRQRIVQPTASAALSSMLARPAYTDGVISGRLQSARTGWRAALLAAADPSSGADQAVLANAPRGEGAVLATMVTATDVGTDGRFAFRGLRDGYYVLALMGPEGSGIEEMQALRVRGDPGVIRMEPARRTKDIGVVVVDY
jgi:hypothetical protein